MNMMRILKSKWSYLRQDAGAIALAFAMAIPVVIGMAGMSR